MNSSFKTGDKIICINNSCSNYLVLNKIYTVNCVNISTIILENNKSYFPCRFILLSEYRKQKIENLYE